MEGPEQGNRVADPPGNQIGFQRGILRAVARLRVHSDSACNVQDWNDLHRPHPSNRL
jgi:hypothetical protein